MSETCSTCKFWRDGNVGKECQRFPPQVLERSGYMVAVFPHTGSYEWCGEHKRKEAA